MICNYESDRSVSTDLCPESVRNRNEHSIFTRRGNFPGNIRESRRGERSRTPASVGIFPPRLLRSRARGVGSATATTTERDAPRRKIHTAVRFCCCCCCWRSSSAVSHPYPSEPAASRTLTAAGSRSVSNFAPRSCLVPAMRNNRDDDDNTHTHTHSRPDPHRQRTRKRRDVVTMTVVEPDQLNGSSLTSAELGLHL